MKCKIKSVCKYNLFTQMKSVLVYYGIVLAVVAFSIFLNLIGDINGSINGVEFASFIFLFVLSLVDFSENFNMLTNNSVSRKNIFVGKVITFTIITLAMAVVDRVLVGLLSLSNHLEFGSIVESMFRFLSTNMFIKQLQMFLITFTFYIAVVAFGTFLSILFYRASKAFKVIIAAGVPVLIFIFLPIIIAGVVSTKTGSSFITFMIENLNTPYRISFALVIVTIILGFIDWLTMRRVTVNTQAKA